MIMLGPILGEIGTAQAIFLIGMALLIVILMVRSRRYFRQVTQYQVPRPDAGGSRAPQPSAKAMMPPREFERWEVAMHDLARDLSGQLDSKIRILELLIRDADKVAARLETTLGRARNGSVRSGTEQTGPQRTESEPPREKARSTGDPSNRAGTPPTAPVLTSSAPSAADKPRFDRIYALADAGLSPAKIANQIGSQVGEVELILGIRGKGRAAMGEMRETEEPNGKNKVGM